MKILTFLFAATLTAAAATNELGDTIVTNLPIAVVRPVSVAPAVRVIADVEKLPIFPRSALANQKAAALKEFKETGSTANLVELKAKVRP